tara:strand:- start:928 stop:1140 length:213 start_codon:yes stop_codon:yes gene_type:complete
MRDKYDEAIEFLQSVEPGSYFDECAELIQGLLAQVEELKPCEESEEEALERWKEGARGFEYYLKCRNRLP